MSAETPDPYQTDTASSTEVDFDSLTDEQIDELSEEDFAAYEEHWERKQHQERLEQLIEYAGAMRAAGEEMKDAKTPNEMIALFWRKYVADVFGDEVSKEQLDAFKEKLEDLIVKPTFYHDTGGQRDIMAQALSDAGIKPVSEVEIHKAYIKVEADSVDGPMRAYGRLNEFLPPVLLVGDAPDRFDVDEDGVLTPKQKAA